MGELYDSYGKLAYTLILRIVPEPEIAADLLAETLVTAWNQMGRWKEARTDDLGLWICLLARNHAIDRLRALNEPVPRALPKLAALSQPSLLQEFAGPRDPEQREKLQNALASLTKEEREILEMACFDGAPLNEIALKQGEPLASLKATIALTMEKLGSVHKS